MHALLGQLPDVTREILPHPPVQLASGHPAIDFDRSNNWFGNFNMRHPDQPGPGSLVPQSIRA
jgi:hypothetical protein